MAASRWKRFAFFDRNTLRFPKEVTEDLSPDFGIIGQPSRRRVYANAATNASITSFTTTTTTTTTATSPWEEEDSIRMVVSIASLPVITQTNMLSESSTSDNIIADINNGIPEMWKTIMACTEPKIQHGLVPLSSQTQAISDNSRNISSNQKEKDSIAVDGLVLVFLSSAESPRIHCIDITVRCNPPNSTYNATTANNAGSSVVTDRMEEEITLDGWRGYFCPFEITAEKSIAPTAVGSSSTATHDTAGDTIIDIAQCRRPDSEYKIWVACLSGTNLVVCEDPHLGLSCRLPLVTKAPSNIVIYRMATPWNEHQWGRGQSVAIASNYIAVGTNNGTVQIFALKKGFLRSLLTIPSPASNQQVTAIRFTISSTKVSLFVCYQHRIETHSFGEQRNTGGGSKGICCFNLGSPNDSTLSAPLSRHDLDSRPLLSSRLCDAIPAVGDNSSSFLVARADGLYNYSETQKLAVSPIDGIKLAICNVPSHSKVLQSDGSEKNTFGSSYTLVASTDAKSGRDAIDVYDTANKLVGFHVLLSPSQMALHAVGVVTPAKKISGGINFGGRSSAIILTVSATFLQDFHIFTNTTKSKIETQSGGTLVILTEKVTAEKVSLLTQKNLYGAAISMAYADPTFQPADIAALYRRYAEHLYRKGDFNAAMEQYIYTIGSLEASHVIFRYLDAPKIPMLTTYLEELRSRDMATPAYDELLKTCYLKLGDVEAADRITATSANTSFNDSCASIVTSLTHNPKEALATVCTFEAPKAAEALVLYGAALARALPRETAGIVVALCLGTYSPSSMAEAANKGSNEASRILKYPTDDRDRRCTPYPVHLFASSFLENPKMLRLILAHCNRNKCALTPNLRRTLLELTLAEWNNAKRYGDTEAEKLRRKEAIAALTDAHSTDIGDYDALVLVQLAGFTEGELLLYERLQMVPMLLSRYAMDGGDRARRQMLAMCRSDPEILAEVLGHFVQIACEKVTHDNVDDASVNSEEEEILDDIREALALAKSQGVLPPVRIARILAGEDTGPFSVVETATQQLPTEVKGKRTVPLSVALEYVGDILDESMGIISRLQTEVDSYTELCNTMEAEVEALRKSSTSIEHDPPQEITTDMPNINEVYARVQAIFDESPSLETSSTLQYREAFWREMNQSDDRFDIITRYFAKGLIP
jgi:vacuolar protein sorting-associated protein 11